MVFYRKCFTDHLTHMLHSGLSCLKGFILKSVIKLNCILPAPETFL